MGKRGAEPLPGQWLPLRTPALRLIGVSSVYDAASWPISLLLTSIYVSFDAAPVIPFDSAFHGTNACLVAEALSHSRLYFLRGSPHLAHSPAFLVVNGKPDTCPQMGRLSLNVQQHHRSMTFTPRLSFLESHKYLFQFVAFTEDTTNPFLIF